MDSSFWFDTINLGWQAPKFFFGPNCSVGQVILIVHLSKVNPVAFPYSGVLKETKHQLLVYCKFKVNSPILKCLTFFKFKKVCEYDQECHNHSLQTNP